MFTQRVGHFSTLLGTLAALAIVFPTTGCGKVRDLVKAKQQGGVLARVEVWKAPPIPEGGEPYDSIKRALELKAMGGNPPGADKLNPLPPTLVDTLLSDFRTIAFYDLGTRLDAATVTVADTQKIVDFIAKTEWTHIRGYRPWTHKSFVDSLTAPERTTLASDAAAYLNKNGFLAYDSLPKTAPPAPADNDRVVSAVPPTSGDVTVFAGTYSGNWGPIMLSQSAASPKVVTGRYAKGGLTCVAVGATIACGWRESGSTGRAVFTRRANGSMVGTWGNGTSATNGGAWNLTLKQAGALN